MFRRSIPQVASDYQTDRINPKVMIERCLKFGLWGVPKPARIIIINISVTIVTTFSQSNSDT